MKVKDSRKGNFDSTFSSLLQQGLEVDVPVFGLSMFPLYFPGDEVRIKQKDSLLLKVGDVVVFQGMNKLILHRLVFVDLEQNVAVTKGDGLKLSDKPVSLESIKGVVIKHTRKGRNIKWTEYSIVKKMMFVITPVAGYFNFYMARVGVKVNRLLG